jgi:GTP pyrophosphokinase
MNQLQNELQATGVDADISGRAKHIYSIWRKMQRKGWNSARSTTCAPCACWSRKCATATPRWASSTPCGGTFRKFDDYIANPKENGYRSLHTAVIGPEGKVLEVQIRTHAMHEEAELGVCAHWRYKGTDVKSGSNHYEEKISWLRRCSNGMKNWATSAAWRTVAGRYRTGSGLHLHP